jgi:NodT family efflux transporter outer membrane factor (OMF) lipoprotein
MNTRILLGTAACLTLASCAIKDPPSGANIMPQSARDKIPGNWAGPHRSGNVVPDWIRTFGDSELTALVADAVTRNPDLRAAAARVEASRYAVKVAAAALYPQIAMKGLGERQGREITSARGLSIDPPTFGGLGVPQSGGSGDTSNLLDRSTQRWVYGLGIGAAWEADVWGRVRSKKAAAQADSAALEADYEYARQSLAAAVARAYFSVIEAAQQEANAQETLNLYEDYSKLTEEKKKQGHASDYDVAQIRSRTAGAKDTYFAAQAARAQAIRAIEVVTSNYPAGKLGVRRSFPAQPKAVPAGLPTQILERRPDIVASERRFAAAFHRTNEARTARLPRFALSAGGGMGTAQLDTVGVMDAVTWSLAAGITQPIFFGGELKAAQDIRTAEQKAAAASYVGVALRAFEDVENALAGDFYLRKREGALNEMVSASADAVKLGRGRLDEGQEDMFTILRLAGENLAAKIQLTQIRAARLRERVNLHLALGGDFKGTGAPAK